MRRVLRILVSPIFIAGLVVLTIVSPFAWLVEYAMGGRERANDIWLLARESWSELFKLIWCGA